MYVDPKAKYQQSLTTFYTEIRVSNQLRCRMHLVLGGNEDDGSGHLGSVMTLKNL